MLIIINAFVWYLYFNAPQIIREYISRLGWKKKSFIFKYVFFF